jgi:hypothetical protein
MILVDPNFTDQNNDDDDDKGNHHQSSGNFRLEVVFSHSALVLVDPAELANHIMKLFISCSS